MLLKCCSQYVSKFVKLHSGYRTGKGQFSFQSPEKGCGKRISNYQTIVFISHASKVMLKIVQAKFQKYLNWEVQVYKLGLEKAEEPEIKLPHLLDHWECKRIPEKHLLLLHWLC